MRKSKSASVACAAIPRTEAAACSTACKKARGRAVTRTGISRGLKNSPLDCFLRAAARRPVCFLVRKHKNKPSSLSWRAYFGDPYGNRTHVTAVKGPCLNRLTNGPLQYKISLKQQATPRPRLQPAPKYFSEILYDGSGNWISEILYDGSGNWI